MGSPRGDEALPATPGVFSAAPIGLSHVSGRVSRVTSDADTGSRTCASRQPGRGPERRWRWWSSTADCLQRCRSEYGRAQHNGGDTRRAGARHAPCGVSNPCRASCNAGNGAAPSSGVCSAHHLVPAVCNLSCGRGGGSFEPPRESYPRAVATWTTPARLARHAASIHRDALAVPPYRASHRVDPIVLGWAASRSRRRADLQELDRAVVHERLRP